MSICKWEETEQNLEQHIIKVASFHVNILHDSFEAYFPSHQAAGLKSKLWILNPFGKQQPPGPLGQILKNDFCQQAFLIVENMLNFGPELLMEHTNTWRFKHPKSLCKTLPPTRPKRGLVH